MRRVSFYDAGRLVQAHPTAGAGCVCGVWAGWANVAILYHAMVVLWHSCSGRSSWGMWVFLMGRCCSGKGVLERCSGDGGAAVRQVEVWVHGMAALRSQGLAILGFFDDALDAGCLGSGEFWDAGCDYGNKVGFVVGVDGDEGLFRMVGYVFRSACFEVA